MTFILGMITGGLVATMCMCIFFVGKESDKNNEQDRE